MGVSFSGRYPSSVVSKGSLDASLAANLPAVKAVGDCYDISVAGSFENSATIIPASAYFDPPDQIRWNGTNWVKMESGNNVSDAAFDASWDGNVNNAPSKNAVYDEMVLKMDKASNLSDVADIATSRANIDVNSKVEVNKRLEERNWYRYTIPLLANDGLTNYTWFEHFKVTADEPFSVMVRRDGEGHQFSDFGYSEPDAVSDKEIQNLLYDAVLDVTDPNGCGDAVTGTTSIVKFREILSQDQLGTDTVHIYFSDGGSPTAKRWQLSSTFDIYVSTDNNVSVEANYADSEDVTFMENFFAINPTSSLQVVYPSLPIRDNTFGVGWDGDTYKAPSRNAVYDEVIKKVNILDSTTAGFGFVIDEDNLASNLDTKVPTQQSVKAYADGKVNDTAFAAGWDADTTVAPSKNAVYDVLNPIKTKSDQNNVSADIATQTYTIQNTDHGKTLFFTYAGAVTITAPQSLADTVHVTCVPVGASTTLAFVAGAGATLNSKGGLLNIADQYSAATAVHRGSNAWYLFGNLS
jgi:hypothetical protein